MEKALVCLPEQLIHGHFRLYYCTVLILPHTIGSNESVTKGFLCLSNHTKETGSTAQSFLISSINMILVGHKLHFTNINNIISTVK